MSDLESFEEFIKKEHEKARYENALNKVHGGLRYIEGYLKDYYIERKVIPKKDKIIGVIIVYLKPPEEKIEEIEEE